MRLYVSTTKGCLIDGPGNPHPLTELKFKRGTLTPLELQFYSGDNADTAVLLVASSVIHFGLKLTGEYEADYLAQALNLDWTAPGTAAGFYTASFDTGTAALNALMFTPDGNLTNDVGVVTLMSVLTWRGPSDIRPNVADELPVTVSNSGDTGTEGVASVAGAALETRIETLEAAAFNYTPLPAVVGYTGGGSTKLDGVATVSISTPHLYSFVHATLGQKFYVLEAGTTAAELTNFSVIHPTDYNASTNAKVFVSTG